MFNHNPKTSPAGIQSGLIHLLLQNESQTVLFQLIINIYYENVIK
jgi:hypothetical protein